MTIQKRHAIIPLVSAGVFSLLYLIAPFRNLEWQIYDIFLGLKPDRPRTEALLLLDVDDRAVAQVGVWPWPRSYMGDAILRLKEFEAKALVFDIEYVESSPSGVDADYYQRGLPRDFQRSFGDIAANTTDLLSAILGGQIGKQDAALYADELSGLIASERDSLLGKTKGLARDNDGYLGKAMALFGSAWTTLNLQGTELDGEQARRRSLWQAFAYPVDEKPGADRGGLVDILAPIPPVLEAAKGAGFTNVLIDKDGVRRRIELARKVDGRWYLQLIFSPLTELLGSPAITVEKRSIKLTGLSMPDGYKGDLVIPLDVSGAMLIDWPKTDYWDSFKPHLSFYALSHLDELERRLDDAMMALGSSEAWFLPDTDGVLGQVYVNLQTAQGRIDKAATLKKASLEGGDEESFSAYLAAREEVRKTAEAFLSTGAAERLGAAAEAAAAASPESADDIRAELERVKGNAAALASLISDLRETRTIVSQAVKDKICIVGWVGTGTTDFGVNPFHGEYINVGTHAAVADTILSRSFMQTASPWFSVLAAFLLAPLIILGIGRFKPGIRTAVGFASVAAILAGSFGVFIGTGIFVGPLVPTLAMALAVVVREAVDFMGAEREKSFLRKAFGTYLSGDVINEIISDPSMLKLGGQKKWITAMFTDVRGFSTISELLDAEQLVKLLNVYLSGMSDIVLEHRGTIDKYEGDAIISFFGAPVNYKEHALQACRSAIMMKRKEAELNARFLADGSSPNPLLTRIGLNTGDMVVGNMGTERKMDYTIMGNAVNLAARLEGVNKQYGSWILMSDDTYKETGDEFLVRRFDKVRVVGINTPVQLWELIDFRSEATPDFLDYLSRFDAAHEVFDTKDWKKALKQFQALSGERPDDGPARSYIKKCEVFLQKPPAPDWDGVFSLTEK
jgi:adenylate cyclase